MPDTGSLLIVDAERYPDGARVDVRLRQGLIAAVSRGLVRERGEQCIQAAGGALLPGLHDHHLHLLALAAARESIVCGPPAVTTRAALEQALRRSPGRGWLRGVGYHESTAGPLDRRRLDAMVPDRPVRIQHASGKAWFLNSAGLRALQLAGQPHLDGVECDAEGEPTGRLFRVDGWMRERLAAGQPPDLAAVSAALARCGVTGVTDTSPDNDETTATLFAAAMTGGALRQRLRMMGGDGLAPGRRTAALTVGELKILLDEDQLPDLDTLIDRVRRAHAIERGVAFHCVTRTELVYALHVLEAAGPRPDRTARGQIQRDRIEHASVVPPDLLPLMRRTGVAVVTQPGFIAERGDRYLAEVDAEDLPHLYRLQTLLAHGIPLGLSTDAPYGDADPWAAMRAAVSRRTAAGVLLGASERLAPEQALAGFLAPAASPGGAPAALAVGSVADLCLLALPWRQARLRLDVALVRMTLRDGLPIYQATAPTAVVDHPGGHRV